MQAQSSSESLRDVIWICTALLPCHPLCLDFIGKEIEVYVLEGRQSALQPGLQYRSGDQDVGKPCGVLLLLGLCAGSLFPYALTAPKICLLLLQVTGVLFSMRSIQ